VQRMSKLTHAQGGNPFAPRLALFEEAQDPSWKTLKKCRERDECVEKLKLLNIL
jgi:hypothetical protein